MTSFNKTHTQEFNSRGMAFRCWWWRNKYKHGTAELSRCFQCGTIIGKVNSDFCENCRDYDDGERIVYT